MQSFKSMGQLGEDLQRAKVEFEFAIDNLHIPDLRMEENLVERTPSLDTILNDLPPE